MLNTWSRKVWRRPTVLSNVERLADRIHRNSGRLYNTHIALPVAACAHIARSAAPKPAAARPVVSMQGGDVDRLILEANHLLPLLNSIDLALAAIGAFAAVRVAAALLVPGRRTRLSKSRRDGPQAVSASDRVDEIRVYSTIALLLKQCASGPPP